ncbi:unnamed protein product [Acanthosepion pharaonis]|uniref:Uncharacterized protein n=1 Tax=Acanthosepion pharaonis TaxID=158019 RepID=A0A812C7X0_ACAPH|nr:unnamed protein product [Sepia pharaonis]
MSPSNTLQVKSGPSFSKWYTCAFLLPVCSLPSSRFLDNRDVGVGVFRSVWSFFLLRGVLTRFIPRLRSRTPSLVPELATSRTVRPQRPWVASIVCRTVRHSVFCFFFFLLLLPCLFLLMSLLDQYSPKTRVLFGLTCSRLDKTNANFSPLSDGRGNSHGSILVNTTPASSVPSQSSSVPSQTSPPSTPLHKTSPTKKTTPSTSSAQTHSSKPSTPLSRDPALSNKSLHLATLPVLPPLNHMKCPLLLSKYKGVQPRT